MLQSTHANVDFKVNLKRIHKTLFVLSFEKCVYSSTSDVFSTMLVISKKGGGGSPQDQFVFVFKVLSAFHIRLHVLEAGPYKVMMSEDVVRETKLTNSFS